METYLVHHGIKGQKWGIRRYQNEDGTLTEDGKKRLQSYRDSSNKMLDRKYNKRIERASIKSAKRRGEYDVLSDQYSGGSKLERARKRLNRAEFKESILRGREAVERKAVQTATIKDVMKEEKAELTALAVDFVISMGSLGLMAAGITPFSVMAYPNYSAIRESERRDRLGEQPVEEYRKQSLEELKRKQRQG